MPSRRFLATLLLGALALSGSPLPSRAQQTVSPELYAGLRWRFIGPMRGGRTVALQGVANEPNVFYIAAVNGGIWKTEDAGRTWIPIFDGEPTGSIGALAVAPSDPASSTRAAARACNARTCRSATASTSRSTAARRGRTSACATDSRSVDGRRSQRIRTGSSSRCSAIRTAPTRNAASTGRSTAAPAFQRVLFENENAGGFDVVDRSATIPTSSTRRSGRRARRRGKSARRSRLRAAASSNRPTAARPGRSCATACRRASGAPKSPSRPATRNVVYAYADVEAKGDDEGALYRSDDAGAHFTRVNNADEIAQRGDDLVSLAVDPHDPNTVYLTNTSTYRSTDGGKTLIAIKGAPGGDDYHTVWINPNDPRIIALASDQGATISVDGGANLELLVQPADGADVSRERRPALSVLGLRRPAGERLGVREQPRRLGRDHRARLASGRRARVRLRRSRSAAPGVFFGGKVEKFDERTGQTQEVSPIALPSKRYRTVRTEPLAFDHFDTASAVLRIERRLHDRLTAARAGARSVPI